MLTQFSILQMYNNFSCEEAQEKRKNNYLTFKKATSQQAEQYGGFLPPKEWFYFELLCQ